MGRRYQSGGGMGCLGWGLIGCAGAAAAGVGLVVVIAVLASRDAKQKADALAEADKLYQTGKVADAVAKYNEGYSAAAADRKGLVVQRIVDHEAGLGARSEAKKWIEKGLDDKVAVSPVTPAGRALLEEVQKERDARLAQKRADDEARDKQRQGERDDRDQVRKNRSLPRDEFRALLKGKTQDEVIRLIGRPDEVVDVEGLGGKGFNYLNVARTRCRKSGRLPA
jgi:hypothetical protein